LTYQNGKSSSKSHLNSVGFLCLEFALFSLARAQSFIIANLSCKKLYFNCSACVQHSRLHIEQINQISNSHRNLKSRKAIIFIKTYGFTYLKNFRILSSSNEQSHQYTRKGLMSLINTEIKPFNATAYHKGQFVEVS